MNSPENSYSFCVFCLWNDVFYGNESMCINSIEVFLKSLARFVGEKELQSCLRVMKCCQDCLLIITSFCDVYHQFKCLELQLEWKLWKLARIMKLANKVPSRVTQANKLLHTFETDGKDGSKLFTDFRKNILQKCQLKWRTSQARVSLQREKSPMPVVYEPVFIKDFNESFHTRLDRSTQEIEKSVECESDIHFEDPASDTHETEIDNYMTENTKNTIKRAQEDVEQKVKEILHLNITDISESTEVSTPSSTLGIKNVISTSHLICKTEHQTPENDTKMPSICGNRNTTTVRRNRYNLRKKSTLECVQPNIIDTYIYNNSFEGSSNSSKSSFFETSSESTSSDEEYDVKPHQSSLSNIRKNKRVNKKRSDQVKYFYCNYGKCKIKFGLKESYKNHLKLHSKGKFSCSYCSKVESSIVLLSLHEFKIYGMGQNRISMAGGDWLCPRCPFNFSYQSDYMAHFARTHFREGTEPPNRRVFENCQICGRQIWEKFKDMHFRNYHDTTKLDDKKIKRCQVEGCLAYFIHNLQLQSHYKLEHQLKMGAVQKQKPRPKIFQCLICLKKFSHRLKLQHHKRQLHSYQLQNSFKNPTNINNTTQIVAQTSVILETETNGVFICKFCKLVQDTPTDLALHEAERHSSETFSCSRKSKNMSKCPRCPYQYICKKAYVRHHLNIHLDILNSESSSACKLCSAGNVYRKNSEDHFKTYHRIDDGTKPQKCDKCPAYFRKPFQLKLHKIKIHQQDNKCDICGKQAKTRHSLLGHFKVMHPLKDTNPDLPFGCNVISGCTKRFGTKVEWEHHQKYARLTQRERTMDANMKCTKCNKAFTCRTSLQAHLSKVHGNKPFVCDKCGKAFKYEIALDLHLEFHKGPEQWKWQCAECGKKSATKQKFEEHMRTHTKEKPFICQLRGEKYTHRHNWRNHLKTKHGDEEGVEEIIGKRKEGDYAKGKGTKKGDCIMATK